MTEKTKEAPVPKSEMFWTHRGYEAIMLFSHALVLYLWLSLELFDGCLWGWGDWENASLKRMKLWSRLQTSFFPAVAGYMVFIGVQICFALWLPGVVLLGLPLPSEGGKRLSYLCNALSSWYASLGLAAALHLSGVLPLDTLVDYHGPLVLASMFCADATAVAVYWWSPGARGADTLDEFFMGRWLNPRLFNGRLDLKMFFEVRVSWLLLFFLTLSAALKQGREELTGPMAVMLLAHLLYANACMKGEDCIPTTWDIFHEKWGWMLIFWNLCGVPMVYSFNSVFLLRNSALAAATSTAYCVVLAVFLCAAYYVFDVANAQKNRFRMMRLSDDGKTHQYRPYAFPQFAAGFLSSPEFMLTRNRGSLLVDGFFRYARKPHYTADLAMGLVWGLSSGGTHFLPFLYPLLFATMIAHRGYRDFQRCQEKYGVDWQVYCRRVPYTFIPGVI